MKIYWEDALSYNVALIVVEDKMVSVHMTGLINDLQAENGKESSLWIKVKRNGLKPWPKGSAGYNAVLKKYLETLRMVTLCVEE